jgi:hypothetical protein
MPLPFYSIKLVADPVKTNCDHLWEPFSESPNIL